MNVSQGFKCQKGISRARLNIHAWRCALHLAWLHGNEFITEAEAEAGIQLADFQAKMREWYAPPEGETRDARCEAKIRKVMRAKKRPPLFDLKRATNYSRVGIAAWEPCLTALVRGGELRLVEENGRNVVILLKTKK